MGTETEDEVFALCAERRRAVADLLKSLTDEQLSTQSLCGEWDVRTVAGHLTVPLVTSPAQVVREVVRHGGSFPRASTALSRRAAEQPVTAIAATLRERARSRFTPPMHGAAAPLTDPGQAPGDPARADRPGPLLATGPRSGSRGPTVGDRHDFPVVGTCQQDRSC